MENLARITASRKTGAEPLVMAVAARGRLDGGDEGDEGNYEGIWMVASTPA